MNSVFNQSVNLNANEHENTPPPPPPPSKGSSRRGRFAGVGFALTAVFLASIGGFAAPASADVLLSNIAQTTQAGTKNRSAGDKVLQKFRTGFHSEGYALTSIEIGFQGAVNAADLRVEVWSGTTAARPVAKFVDLTVPASVEAGFVTFAAPANTTLAANTSYFAYIYRVTGNTLPLKYTESADLDPANAGGWNFETSSTAITASNALTSVAQYIQMRVNGTLKNPPAVPTTPSIWSATLTVSENTNSNRRRGCGTQSNMSFNLTDCATALTDNTVTIDNVDYTITQLYIDRNGGNTGRLVLQFEQVIRDNFLLWNRGSSNLVFNLGESAFDVSTYSSSPKSETVPSGKAMLWGTFSEGSNDWSKEWAALVVGGTISVSLVYSANNDASLSNLSIIGSTDGSTFSATPPLIPDFDPDTRSYAAEVGSAVTHVKLKPTAGAFNRATVKAGKAGEMLTAVTGGESNAITLTYGVNNMQIEVDALDAVQMRTYTVAITRLRPAVSLSARPNPVTEGKPVTITATLETALPADVVIQLTQIAGSGTTSNDFGTLESITIPSGQTSATGTITTTADDPVATKTVTVALGTLPDTVRRGSTDSITITINDATVAPNVSLSVTPNPVPEGQTATVTVTLSETLTTAQSIPITLTPSADRPPESDDHSLSITSISVPANETTGTATFTTTADDDNEDEIFTVALGTPLPTKGADNFVPNPTANTVSVTILDNDPTKLTLTADPLRVIPGGMATIKTAFDKPALIDTNVTLTASYTHRPPASTGTYTFDTTTLAIAGGSMDSTTTTFTVSENTPAGTRIELTASAMSSTYKLDDSRVIEVVSPLQAEQLHQAILPEVARAVAGRVTSAISMRVGQVLNGSGGGGGNTASVNLGGQGTLAGVLQTHAPSLINDGRPLRDLLHGSDFVLPLNGDGGGGGSRSLSLWGSGEYRNLSGEDDNVEFDGDMYGAQIGVDSEVRENMLAGVALSWSEGEFEYEDTNTGEGQGDYAVDMIALHPYLGGHIGLFDWWATLGYGNGEVTVTPDSGEAASNDLSMTTLGAGGSGLLWSRDDTRVHLKSGFTHTRMDVDKSDRVDSLSVDTHLARIALAASRTRSLAGGGGQRSVVPSLSLGVRQDGGDGNTGSGAEIGGSVRYDNAQSGMSASVSAHALLGRSDYEEWGVQAFVQMSPGADGQGLSFVMKPGYGNNGGASAGGTGRIWSNGLRGDAIPTAHDPSGRLEMRLGYGLSVPGGRTGLLTPWSGLTLHDDGKRYRLGLDLESAGPFTLRLHGERRESASADADHAVLLKGEAHF